MSVSQTLQFRPGGPGVSRVVGVAARAHPGLTTWYVTTDVVVPHKPCRAGFRVPSLYISGLICLRLSETVKGLLFPSLY